MPWDLSCRDWEARIAAGRSIIPDLPLFEDEARIAAKFYGALRLPDVSGTPTLAEASGEWFVEVVRVLFGSRDPASNYRYIEEIFVLVPKKNSKALALDSLIATPDGFTTMGAVAVGDLVMAQDGRPTKVVAKSPVYLGRPCYDVEFSTGEVVRCDAEHLWVTDSHKDRWRMPARRTGPTAKTTAEIARSLKVGEINNHRTALPAALDLPEAALPIPPYVLGLWLGDGTSESAEITSGIADADHLMTELRAAGQECRGRVYASAPGNVTIKMTRPDAIKLPYRFRTEAARLGVLGNKHIPAMYQRGSQDQRLALLKGLMDSDGHIDAKGGAAFTTTLPALRDGVCELVASLGLKPTCSSSIPRCSNGKAGARAWLIQFHPFDMPVCTVPRKLARQRPRAEGSNSARSRFRQIADVRPALSVPVQCIAVESETRQYLVTRSLIPTHNTTYGAALMLTALFMNVRPRAEFLFVGPTQAISDLAYSQATGMIELDAALTQRFKVRDHIKEIADLLNGARLKIKTFDLDILTGPRPAGTLLDELHLLGRSAATPKVIRQLRGGRASIAEGFMVILTTQSDERPAGAFKAELLVARDVREGNAPGSTTLPVLYEFPRKIAKDEALWSDERNWHMVMPNLGRSLRLPALLKDWLVEAGKGTAAKQIWASQHLNIEIGVGLTSDSWVGAEHWAAAADPSISTLAAIIARSDVICAGIDGGGLDDLLGLAILGRERITRRWLLWTHAWCDEIVLTRRASEESKLRDFEAAGELSIVGDIQNAFWELAQFIAEADASGLLAYVGLDPVGVGMIVDALAERGIGGEDADGSGKQNRVVAISQGWTLSGAIKTTEVKLKSKTLAHGGQGIMEWCAGNARTEARGNATVITKQAAGTAKIDPLMATFDAVALMSRNPESPLSVYETRDLVVL